MITKRNYIEYLISTPVNYTCSNLANHLKGVSHDAITDYLQREKITAHHLWELVQPLVQDSRQSYLIVDDSVQDKRFSQKIELVKRQYSGNEHGLVRGIGVVNLVHSAGTDYYPIDYCIYSPESDGKNKNVHFRQMLMAAIADKRLQAQTILFDSWYGGVDNLKFIHRLNRYFITALKSNRKVSLTKEGGYIDLKELSWNDAQFEQGQIVKLKEVPFKMKLFKLVASNGDIEWVITNNLSCDSADFIQDENTMR